MSIEKMLAECRAHWEKTKPDAVFADYWIGWRESRESLVFNTGELADENTCPLSVESYWIKQIEAAGLRVKS